MFFKNHLNPKHTYYDLKETFYPNFYNFNISKKKLYSFFFAVKKYLTSFTKMPIKLYLTKIASLILAVDLQNKNPGQIFAYNIHKILHQDSQEKGL